MDSEHWISRLAAAKRFYVAQLDHIEDMAGMGMEEVEMELEDDGEMDMEMEMHLEEVRWPEVACPYCYEDYDLASLCVHLEEDHPYEHHAAGPPGTGKTQTILGAVLHSAPTRMQMKHVHWMKASPWLIGANLRDLIMPIDET